MSETLQHLVGLRCHDLRVIAGGTLIVFIGDRDPATQLTEWRLHVDSAWRIESQSAGVLASLDFPIDEEPHEAFLDRLNAVRGAAIKSVTLDSPVLDLAIEFSNSHMLRSFAHFRVGEHWELRHCSGYRLTMNDMVVLREHNESPDAPRE